MMAQDRVVAGDTVHCIDDRRVGVVTSVIGDYVRMTNLDGVVMLIPQSDVYTVAHNRVTLMRSYAAYRGQGIEGGEAPRPMEPIREAQEA